MSKIVDCKYTDSLINFIKDHDVSVKGVSLDGTHIVVTGLYSKDGKAFTQDDVVEANLQAVRDYLGY